VTLAELQQRTLQRLDESTSSPAAVTVDDVTAALNEGQRLFAAISLCIERTERLELEANTVWYNASEQIADWFLPLRCMQRPIGNGTSLFDIPTFDSVEFDEAAANAGTPARVRPARLAELDALNPSWQNVRSSTTLRYGLFGFDTLFIYPAPAVAGVSLEITYAAVPREMSIDGEEPDIPVQFQQFLIDFAIATLRLPDGGAQFERSKGRLSKFLDAAQACAELTRARSKTLQYDREPFELKAFDRSRLLSEPKKRKPAA
jgi:hypothetical protein